MNDFDVLMPDPLPSHVVEEIGRSFRLHKLWEAQNPQTMIAEVGNHIQGLVTGHFSKLINADFMRRFPKLRIVAHYGVGYDSVDAKWAGQNNIIVTNTPDVLTDEVADLALGLTIATIRKIPQADSYLRAGKWEQNPFPLTGTLRGRTMGILGLGRIGKAIAHRAEAFGLKIIYHGRKAQADAGYPFYPDLTEMAREADILMVVAPATPETKNIVDAKILKSLGPEGVLVNVSRGSLVDEPALIAALRDKTISAAGLDVFANEPHVPQELMKMENAVLLPHVGSGSHETRRAMGQLVIDNLVSFVAGKGPLTPVKETPYPPGES
jgi:lactate dehydrogenase-like 2-hydroxyacid dehydrogenase